MSDHDSNGGLNGGLNGKVPQIGAGRRPIRLLEIIGNAIVGGMETYTRNLIASLPRDEYEVTCILPYESAYTASLRAIGCKIFVTPILDDPLWRSIEMAVEVVKLNRIDVIHANLPNAHTLAGIVGRITNVPVVATIHSRSLWIQELSVARMTGVNLITVCQEAFAGALAAGIAPENLTLVHNGVDTTRFTPQRSGQAFRDAIGIGPETRLVGFVGRLSFEKGPDKFVEAARQIGNVFGDVHFAIIGEGPMEADLRNMLAGQPIGERVHLVGLRRDVEHVYPAFDLVLQTSRSEAMPLALLEAMASGVPVVALAVGGVAEIVECGTTGQLVWPGDWPGVLSPYPGDWPGIAAAAIELLHHPERLRRMGESARRRVVEQFDLQDSVRETCALFRRLVTPAKKDPAWQPTVVRGKTEAERRLRLKAAAAEGIDAVARSGLTPVRAAEGS